MASKLESDRGDTLDWDRKWLVDCNTGITQVVLLDWSNNTIAIDMKMDESVLVEKLSFKMLGLTFVSKLDWDSYFISVTLICFMSLLCITTNLPYGRSWYTVFMSGLGLLVATRNFLISYKNRYAGLLVLSLLPLLNLLLYLRNVGSLSLFYRYYSGRCSSELVVVVPLPSREVYSIFW